LLLRPKTEQISRGCPPDLISGRPLAQATSGPEPATDWSPHPLHLLQRHLVDPRHQAQLLRAVSRKVRLGLYGLGYVRRVYVKVDQVGLGLFV